MNMSLVVYGIRQSPPVRAVLLTARAIGLDVDFRLCDLNQNQHLNEDYCKMNPAHTIPVLDDQGFILFESRAIMTYLVTKYGVADDQLYPKDVQRKAMVDNMLHFDNGSLWPAIRRAFFGPILQGVAAPSGAIENFQDKLKTLEKILTASEFVAGDKLTLADISMVSSLTFPTVGSGYGLDHYPRIKSWSARVVNELPFYDEVTSEGLDTLKQTAERNWKKMQGSLL